VEPANSAEFGLRSSGRWRCHGEIHRGSRNEWSCEQDCSKERRGTMVECSVGEGGGKYNDASCTNLVCETHRDVQVRSFQWVSFTHTR
jgi:hypothetical protein